MTEEFNYPHLPLINISIESKERYKPNSGYDRSQEQDFKKHSDFINKKANDVKSEIEDRAKTQGINPRLIFKIEFHEGLTEEQISSSGLNLLSDIDKNAQVVFSDDQEMKVFFEKLNEYSKGSEFKKQKNPSYNVIFSNIKEIKPLGPEDRKGPLLEETYINNDKIYWLDVELWYRGSKSFCKDDREDIKKIIFPEGKITDYFDSNGIHILRVKAIGKDVKKLLKQDIVSEIDFPAKLQSHGIKKLNSDIDDLIVLSPSDEAQGVCIIDSGISPRNPLLEKSIADYDVFRDDLENGIDQSGHGTFVAGIALYGNVDKCIENKEFAPEVKLYSARLTDENDQLGPSEKLYINQIREAIIHYNEKYNCRVFNISLGNKQKKVSQLTHQTRWAYILDNLVRERDIIIVLSAGNIEKDDFDIDDNELIDFYPGYMFEKNKSLIDPAMASLCVTVGSIALEPRTSRDLYNSGEPKLGVQSVPITKKDEPSPFSRTGYGINGSIKPDFVSYGGTYLYDGLIKSVNYNGNINNGVISTNYNYSNDNKLFSADIGTSFAAPYIANMAAKILNIIPEATNNTVRALIANSANNSDQTVSSIESYMENANSAILHDLKDELDEIENESLREKINDCIKRKSLTKDTKNKLLCANDCSPELKHLLHKIPAYTSDSSNELKNFVLRACGYGFPQIERAVNSSDNVVTLFAENKISLDKFHIYELPIVDEFLNKPEGIRKIIISLAYSPFIRHTRRAYHSYSMNFELLRGLDIDEVIKIASNEEDTKSYSKLGAKRCSLDPTSNFLKNSSLQRAEFVMKQKPQNDYGDTYYLIVKSLDNWASNAADFIHTEKEAYSLAVTFELEDEIEIYDKLQERIQTRIRENATNLVEEKELVKINYN